MPFRRRRWIAALATALAGTLAVAIGDAAAPAKAESSDAAEVPPLLARAVQHWDDGATELAFTQTTQLLNKDGSVAETRVERYDPSRPTSERWKLVSVDGTPPTPAQVRAIEDKRNRKPRRQPLKSLGAYLNFNDVETLEGDAAVARYRVAVDREAASFFVPVHRINFILTVDRETADIVHIAAGLEEEMRVVFGLARVQELAFDIELAEDDEPDRTVGALTADSKAEALVRKFGRPYKFTWTDLERVHDRDDA